MFLYLVPCEKDSIFGVGLSMEQFTFVFGNMGF